MDATIKAIELHIAQESYGAALLASIEGSGTEAAVAAALVILEARELAAERAAERAAFTVSTSHYATNGR